MKTVRNARQSIMGPGGAVVRAMSDNTKAAFVQKAEELGRQIATDNNVDFEIGDVPDTMLLSDTAVSLLEELESIKDKLLRGRAA